MTDMKNATKEELKKMAAEAKKLAKKAGKMAGGMMSRVMNMLKIPLIIMAVLAIVFCNKTCIILYYFKII